MAVKENFIIINLYVTIFSLIDISTIKSENKSGILDQIFYRIFLQIDILADGLEDILDLIFPGSFHPLQVSQPPVCQASQYQGRDGEGSEEDGGDEEDKRGQQ